MGARCSRRVPPQFQPPPDHPLAPESELSDAHLQLHRALVRFIRTRPQLSEFLLAADIDPQEDALEARHALEQLRRNVNGTIDWATARLTEEAHGGGRPPRPQE